MNDEPDLVEAFGRAHERLMALTDRDPQIARLIPDDAVTAKIKTPGAPLSQIIGAVLSGYAERDAFGSRAYELRIDAAGRHVRNHLPSFDVITYADLARQVEAVAGAWRHVPNLRVGPGDFVAFIGFTGAQYAAIDLACAYAQAIAVPLQANIAVTDMTGILSDTAPVCLIASIDHLSVAVDRAIDQTTIRSLVVIDADPEVDDDRERIEAALDRLRNAEDRITLTTFTKLVEQGSQYPWSPLPPSSDGLEALSLIMYTSGSTGTPKGAMIPERIANQYWNGIARMQPTVTLAYAPLNHFMGRNMVSATLAQGGTVYFTLKSDMSSLFEDLRIARPTFLLFIPRVCELVYQQYQAELQRLVASGETPQAAEATVCDAMGKTVLGDRLLAGGVGSSPTAPEVRAFLRSCFDIAFVEGYGTTEAGGGITSGNRILRAIIQDYRLKDVPELGYRTTDRPYPRGELLVKSTMAIPGYFKRPKESAAIVDADGYQLTGDIVEERGPDHVVWIDRRNNVIKLSQGEYVAIGGLEATFVGGSSLIRQIYVYGSSYRSFLLAVVVPDPNALRDGQGIDLQDKVATKTAIMAELQSVARAAGLKSFEIPRDILIETEPFSHENGLLSSVRKPLRPNLYRRYGERLEALYQDMDRQQHTELALLRQDDRAATVERVAGAFKANLGLAAIDPASDQCFSDLGGDSLGAVSLSALLEDIFDVAVPVSLILHPAGSARRLADFIDNARDNGSTGPTFATVHGPGATVIKASDLTLDRFFDGQTLELAEQAAAPAREIRHVLLTGATGFLGRFLCLSWLERLAQKGGTVTCLIRARDAETARERLIDVLGGPDPLLAAHFKTLAEQHLKVITGDLSAPRLGLAPEQFERLADSIDHIVHPAALVNHRLSYENLFEPNVVGTAELIRLALTGRKKGFDNVSSTAVPAMHPPLRGDEDLDVRVGGASCKLSDGYAVGYGASKWAGEVLLREAHELYGLPVNIFRADMILADRRYVGQINVPDMFTRLLFSVIMTGTAPASFYQVGPDGSRPRAHYDGLPVDFIAEVMQQLGEETQGAFRTYNIVNMHDDGVSLDSVIDWVASAGYSVRRIAEYSDWLAEFEDRLRALPENQRQLSSLAITGGFSEPADPTPAHPSSRRFVEAVRNLRAGPLVPQIDEAFIHKYLADMRSLDLIAATVEIAEVEPA